MRKLSVKPFTGEEKLPDFGCDEEDKEFIDFLTEDAVEFQKQKMSKIYLFNGDEGYVGYCAISTDSVKSKMLSNKMISRKRFTIPALKIGRLFVGKHHRGKGYGTEIIAWCITKAYELSKLTGCRLVIVDAAKRKVDWYKKRGFELVPDMGHEKQDNHKMFFDLDILNKH